MIVEGLFGWSEILCWYVVLGGGGGRVCWKERFGKKSTSCLGDGYAAFFGRQQQPKAVVIF